MSRVLILLAYYDRPKMVLNALDSIRENAKTHDDWILAVLDDSSKIPAAPIVQRELPGFEPKIINLVNDDSPEVKAVAGHAGGEMINRAIRLTTADIALILCDDDALLPTHLRDLSAWYEANPTALSSWSYCAIFDPLNEKPHPSMISRPQNKKIYLNQYSGPIAPSCKVDASQVTWRVSANFEYGTWFPSRAFRNLDASFFAALTERTGLTPCNGLYGQYKGMHKNQLSYKSNDQAWGGEIDIPEETK